MFCIRNKVYGVCVIIGELIDKCCLMVVLMIIKSLIVKMDMCCK